MNELSALSSFTCGLGGIIYLKILLVLSPLADTSCSTTLGVMISARLGSGFSAASAAMPIGILGVHSLSDSSFYSDIEEEQNDDEEKSL